LTKLPLLCVIMFRKICGGKVMSEWNPELYDNEQFIERDL